MIETRAMPTPAVIIRVTTAASF